MSPRLAPDLSGLRSMLSLLTLAVCISACDQCTVNPCPPISIERAGEVVLPLADDSTTDDLGQFFAGEALFVDYLVDAEANAALYDGVILQAEVLSSATAAEGDVVEAAIVGETVFSFGSDERPAQPLQVQLLPADSPDEQGATLLLRGIEGSRCMLDPATDQHDESIVEIHTVQMLGSLSPGDDDDAADDDDASDDDDATDDDDAVGELDAGYLALKRDGSTIYAADVVGELELGMHTLEYELRLGDGTQGEIQSLSVVEPFGIQDVQVTPSPVLPVILVDANPIDDETEVIAVTLTFEVTEDDFAFVLRAGYSGSLFMTSQEWLVSDGSLVPVLDAPSEAIVPLPEVPLSDVVVSFEVSNNGAAPLEITDVLVSDEVNASVDYIAPPLPPVGVHVLGSAESTLIQFSVEVTTPGPYSFVATLENNDPARPSHPVAVVSVAGDIDGVSPMEISIPAGQETVVPFVLNNVGAAPLQVTSLLPNCALCSVAALVSPALPEAFAPGGGPFELRLSPDEVGPFEVGLLIDSDDPDEPSVTYVVNGVATPGPEPEIELSREAEIVDGGTDDVGTLLPLVAQTLTYTVTNVGSGPLTLAPPAFGLAPNAVPALTALPAASVGFLAPTNTTTFEVSVTPSADGAFSVPVQIDNDDSDEDPFDFTITGTAAAPEMELTSGVTIIGTATVLEVGEIQATTEETYEFDVANVGSADLVVSAASVVATGTFGANAEVAPDPYSAVVVPGGASSFDVTVEPTGGAFEVQLEVLTNDPAQASVVFTLSGEEGPEPEPLLSVSDGSTLLVNGGAYDLGSVVTTDGGSATLTLGNGGPGALEVTDIELAPVTNADSPGASVVPPLILPEGDEADVEFTWTASDVGASEATLTVETDGDPAVFTATLTWLSDAPVIEVHDEDGARVAGDPLDFGTIGFEQTAVVPIVLHNTGTLDLEIDEIQVSGLSGASVVLPAGLFPATIPAAGGLSVDVEVEANGGGGAIGADLTIVSDGVNDGAWLLPLVGQEEDPEPELVVTIDGDEVPEGGIFVVGTLRAIGDEPGAVTVTLENDGDADLVASTIQLTGTLNLSGGQASPSSVTVPPGGSEDVELTFDIDDAPGALTGDLSIDSNAPGGLFEAGLSGTTEVSSLELSATGPGVVPDGGTHDVGSLTVGVTTSLSYSLASVGTADLDVSGAALDASAPAVNAALAIVGSPSASALPSGGSLSDWLEVELTPSGVGAFEGTLVVSSDAFGDEAEYTIVISGTAAAPPAEDCTNGTDDDGDGDVDCDDADCTADPDCFGCADVLVDTPGFGVASGTFADLPTDYQVVGQPGATCIQFGIWPVDFVAWTDELLTWSDTCGGPALREGQIGPGVTIIQIDLENGEDAIVSFEASTGGDFEVDLLALTGSGPDADLGSSTGVGVGSGDPSIGGGDDMVNECASGRPDYEFSWTAPSSGTWTFTANDPTGDDLDLSVIPDSSCRAISSLACTADQPGTATVSTFVEAGDLVLIGVAGYGGAFTLDIQ